MAFDKADTIAPECLCHSTACTSVKEDPVWALIVPGTEQSHSALLLSDLQRNGLPPEHVGCVWVHEVCSTARRTRIYR